MQWERPKHLFARTALTASGWQNDVLIEIKDGTIASLKTGSKAPAGAPSFDLVLPGMPNVHSHAFQRAMAGLTEIAAEKGKDNFWTWREVMYGFALKLTPEQIELLARALYIELLKHGYTSVGEFHYLHNDEKGKPYSSITELSDHIIHAAQATGIHLTHLPVLYETANFGNVSASDKQRRFLHSPDSFIALLEALQKKYEKTPDFKLGIAPHSLRAVKTDSLKQVLQALPRLNLSNCPIHIHAAEQEKEVADCVNWSNQRPVEWLLDNHTIDKRWCLIHSTHMTPNEVKGLAQSCAVAGFCPTTEANLGDGIAPVEQYLQAKGAFGIGTDSQICVSPFEELRQLEYAQRLALRKRAVLFDEATPSIGRTLFDRAAAGGAQALGVTAGKLVENQRADIIALSLDTPLLTGKQGDQILDALIFAITPPPVTDVLVGGNYVIRNGHHALEEQSTSDWKRTMKQLVG